MVRSFKKLTEKRLHTEIFTEIQNNLELQSATFCN